jgi:hypothetical protein
MADIVVCRTVAARKKQGENLAFSFKPVFVTDYSNRQYG